MVRMSKALTILRALDDWYDKSDTGPQGGSLLFDDDRDLRAWIKSALGTEENEAERDAAAIARHEATCPECMTTTEAGILLDMSKPQPDEDAGKTPAQLTVELEIHNRIVNLLATRRLDLSAWNIARDLGIGYSLVVHELGRMERDGLVVCTPATSWLPTTTFWAAIRQREKAKRVRS